MKAVITSLQDFSRRTVAAKKITTFLLLILTLNNFVFNCKNYSQIKGCAMRTICEPTYDNIFMDHFERKHIYPFSERLSLNQLRFIVDMFLIWTGSKDQLINLFQRQNLVHINSKHPILLNNSIPYSKISREKRICSTIENFIDCCLERKQEFIERVYKSDLLDKHISAVEKLDRK